MSAHHKELVLDGGVNLLQTAEDSRVLLLQPLPQPLTVLRANPGRSLS